MFDQLPKPSETDPDAPPSIVLASLGVDSTDLIITNGLKIWQRTMPTAAATSLGHSFRMHDIPKAENLSACGTGR